MKTRGDTMTASTLIDLERIFPWPMQVDNKNSSSEFSLSQEKCLVRQRCQSIMGMLHRKIYPVEGHIYST